MTALRVHPPALDSYAGLIRRAADDAREFRTYLDAYVPEISPVTGGIINPLTYEHLTVRRTLVAMLDELVGLLDASQAGVDDASMVYRETDQAAAASLDSAFPGVERPDPDRS
ncbi:hypothetical protein AB0F81_04145 [Actinoplanes sp. NPDC024001]|uniref:hypothetical protein n=1 Tax=Actinoplanes sp. NPDC024001 TaxID=3154598 RepID=UPI0033E078B1